MLLIQVAKFTVFKLENRVRVKCINLKCFDYALVPIPPEDTDVD